ncbi:MAG: tripartite tricarboxylate transporter TctB family protein [Spirochaetota bacterium]|nr:tripartite tricarboxylate transporter TctB family protein [Spirochaetota bacterium]
MSKNTVGALFFLAVSLFYGLMSFTIPLNLMAKKAVFTARTVPITLAVLGTVISLILLILPSPDADGRNTFIKEFRGFKWKEPVLLLGLMIVYSFIIKSMGFIISTVLFLIVGFRILGEQRVKILFLASIPFVLAFWFLISKILGVYLEPGTLFYFLRG